MYPIAKCCNCYAEAAGNCNDGRIDDRSVKSAVTAWNTRADTLSALQAQLAGARNAALEEAKHKAVMPCYATRHVTLGDKVADAIEALKSEPAPRQSVKEAAKVLLSQETGMSDELNSAGWEFIKAWSEIVQEPLSGMAFNHCKPLLRRVFGHYLRALAQEDDQ
jgi:hypothetical protein